MAHKRRIEVPNRAEEVLLSSDQGWKDWLFRTYARVWYWTAVMAIDIALLLELPGARNLSAGVTALVVIAVCLLQIVIHARIWGKGAIWGGTGSERSSAGHLPSILSRSGEGGGPT